METIPVFVKEGAFIPMVQPVNSTDDYSSQKLTVRYYPAEVGDSSFFNMFEDDGTTYGTFGRGEFELLRLRAFQAEGHMLNIDMIRDGWDYKGMPKIREMKLEIVNQDPSKKYEITINGDKLKLLKKDNKVAGYYFEENRLVIKYNWGGDLVSIRIKTI